MMQHNVDANTITALVANPAVVDFVTRLELQNYRHLRRKQQEEMATIYHGAFDLLANAGKDDDGWERTIKTIADDLFRRRDADVWFHRFYDDYSRNVQSELEFSEIRGHIKGNTILDFGCGAATLALRCRQEGYSVLTTDVLDRRAEDGRGLPFRLMTNKGTIPYPDNCADTALVFAVLHHLDASNLQDVLSQLRRVSTRVIIREDVYGVPLDDEEFRSVIEDDELLQRFILLPQEDQRGVLTLHDYVENTFSQGIPEMNFPFQFKTVPEWNSVLVNNGFTVVKTTLIGFKRTKEWSGICHALFVADRD